MLGKFLPNKGSNSLSLRMLFYILLCSTCLAFLITLVQLTWDYRKDVSIVKDNVSQIETSYLQPIAASLWALDKGQVQALADGIINLPDMQYVLVKEFIGNDEVPLLSRGEELQKYDISREFELKYKGQIVGKLFVAASLAQVYQHLWEKALLILVSQTIKTLVVSFVILIIIYQLIVRHLNTIVEYIRKLDLDSLGAPLTLSRTIGNDQDEFAEMVNSFNLMREKIQHEFTAKLSATNQLAKERDFSATIISASNTVITCLDYELNILSSNPAGAKLIGCSPKKLESQNWLNVFIDEDSRVLLKNSQQQLHLLQDQELTLTNTNDVKSTLLWSFVPFDADNSLCRIIAFGYDVTALKIVEHEIKELNTQLEQKVASRTQNLEESNSQLTAAFDELKNTQKSLLEADKMASLGSLVAGVAHEINTPIGISVTAASHLQEKSICIAKNMAEGKLTKSMLEIFIRELCESSELLLNNQRRASDLISSFKQVAVDQSSEAYYTFNVHTHLQQVVTTLRHKLERAQCKVDINCDKNLKICSYPGSFTQIYSNLIINSIVHGFSDWDGERNVSIDIEQENEQLIIDYRDTGRGVDTAIAERIFEPFVTSKRGQGGSGLGTHIMFNLVVHLLKGKIDLETHPEQGTHFILKIPLQTVPNDPNTPYAPNVPSDLDNNTNG